MMMRASWLLLHRTILSAFLWNSSMMATAKIMVAPHKDNGSVQQQVKANDPPPSASSPSGSLEGRLYSPSHFLVGNATGLLADNYRAGGMGATIPSPLVDEHQVIGNVRQGCWLLMHESHTATSIHTGVPVYRS